MLETFVAIMVMFSILAFKFLYIVAILVTVGLVLEYIQHRLRPEAA